MIPDLLNEDDFKIPIEVSFNKACRWYFITAALSMTVYGFFMVIDILELDTIALLAVIIVAIGLSFRMVFLEPERAALKIGTYRSSFAYLALTYFICAQAINVIMILSGLIKPTKFGEYIAYGIGFPFALFIFCCVFLLPIVAYRHHRFLKKQTP